MGYQLVLVNAWVFDQPQVPGGQPPGIWGPGSPMPNPPIQLPPGWETGNPPGIWGGGGVPMPNPPIANVPGAPGYNPQPPGIWGGGNVPMPTPPIQLPPWLITGGQPPGIWGPTDPRPQPPIQLPPGYPGSPPGIWGGGGVPMPNPPIANVPGAPGFPGQQPPGIWGGGNVPMPNPPIANAPGIPGYTPPPTFPILDPDNLPNHPEVPDLNAGSWAYVSRDGELAHAFVPWPLAVTHPDYNPNYPPEENQPGEWVAIYYFDQNFNGLTWAWLPTVPEEAPAP